MPEQISPNQNPNNLQNGFVKKPIETPILNSDLRNQITGNPPTSGSTTGGFKDFYNGNKYYFFAIFLGIVIISVLTFIAFRKPAAVAPREANVNISIQAPETVSSGGDVVLNVKMENKDNQKLVGLQLELVYPDGVVFESSSPNPQSLSGNLFDIPDLIPGQNVVVIVKARASGSVNDTKQLIARLHYKYSNFNSEFVKEQSVTVRLAASNIIFELTGPVNTNNTQIAVYTVKYQNNSGSDIKNARIQLTYPEGFSFASANPNADLSNNIWTLNSLAAGGQGEIGIQGSFRSVGAGESKTMAADFLVLGPDGQYFSQNSATFITAIASTPLLVSQTLQSGGSANSDGVVNPGDSLNFQVKYQNNAATVATGVNILVSLDSSSLDMSTLSAEGGQINGNTILWNASSAEALASLNPSDSGQLSFRVRVKNPASRDSSKNLTITSNIKIKANEYGANFAGNDINLKISSPSSVATNLAFVSGPLPPQVGKTTVYKIKFSLFNSSNDFSGAQLTASIPLGSGGFVEGSVTQSEISHTQFDSSTGKLTWNVGVLPANTGKFSQARVLEFQVRLNPSSSQVGQSPPLIQSIVLNAKDTFTNQAVSARADDISTQDVSGSGYNNGQVLP